MGDDDRLFVMNLDGRQWYAFNPKSAFTEMQDREKYPPVDNQAPAENRVM